MGISLTSNVFLGAMLGVLVSSLSGSLHCVGMCGGLMMNVTRTRTDQILYHLGRLISYLILGALAGAVGKSLFHQQSLYQLQIISSVFVGILFIFLAYRSWTEKPIHFQWIPSRWLEKIQILSYQNKSAPAFFVGISSGILPCGWLQSFVIAALATHSALQGASLLFFFWFGTVPALAGSWTLAEKTFKPLSKYSSKIFAVLLLCLGLWNLTIKNIHTDHSSSAPDESCHHH